MFVGVGPRVAAAAARRRISARRSLSSLANLIENDDSLSSILAHDRYGFLVNGVHMRGSVLVFRKFTLLWDVQRAVDIAPRNAAVVHMVSPRVDLLIIGTGERQVDVNPSLYGYFSRKGVSVEAMSTAHAVALFNTLNQEGRAVAAALVSREPLSRDDACAYVHGQPARTEADARLAAALAADVDAHRAGAAFPIGITGAAGRHPLLIDGGASGAAGGSGSTGKNVAALQQQAAGAAAINTPPAATPRAPTAPRTSPPAPAPRPRGYGVLQHTHAQPGEAAVDAADTAAGAEQQGEQAPRLATPSSPLSPERQAEGEERQRRAQRPESGDDLLDALAERGARRSATGSSRGGGVGSSTGGSGQQKR